MTEEQPTRSVTPLLFLTGKSASRAALVMAEACTIGVAVFPLPTVLNRAWLLGCTYSNQLLIKLSTTENAFK